MAEIIPKIALLSTGDELTNGDVLNTNSQNIAHLLFDNQIQPGTHVTVSDDQAEIEKAIRFLLLDHAGLIITGGLGPTSDDRTRFALSQAIDTELIFNDDCWQRIVARLQRLSLPIPDNNRQQCLFPSSAIIYPNDNGTAAGCLVTHDQKPVFMLPGPPFECLPIFTERVLPYLQTHGFAQPLFRCQWLLLGVSEGSVAGQLDPLMENSDCIVGYRVNQPYVEVKLQSSKQDALIKLRAQFQTLIGDKSISFQKQKASSQLQQWIVDKHCSISFNDQATGGLLATTLLNPQSSPYIHFSGQLKNSQHLHVTLTGLEAFWHNRPENNMLHLDICSGLNSLQQVSLSIPFRKERTPLYAMEMACWEIFKFISK